MASGPCKNHPEITARRRCYTCAQFICTQCQILLNHHYFCSQGCHRRFLLRETIKSFFRPIVETLQPLWHFFSQWLLPKAGVRKTRGLSRDIKLLDLIISLVAVLLLASPLIGIAILLRQNWQLQDRLDSIEHRMRVVSVQAKNSVATTPDNNSFLRLNGPAPAMVTGNQITVEGEAPDGHIISLVQDNWVHAVALPREGKFSLPPVTLKPGQNDFVVQALAHDGNTIALEHITITFGRPTLNFLATDFSRGNQERRQIALTFDGGSTDNAAQQILDILAEHHLQVTVFLTGGFIQKFPEITRRVVQEGHEVGNHTWSHPHLTSFAENRRQDTLPNVTREFVHGQLLRTAKLFEEVTGAQLAPFWRAPFGEHNQEIRQWAAEIGYRHVGWTKGRSWQESMDTLDWVADTTSSVYHSAEEILAHLMSMANDETYGVNGGIMLMHLGSHRQNGDDFYKILPRLISGLREKNYALVKVSALIE